MKIFSLLVLIAVGVAGVNAKTKLAVRIERIKCIVNDPEAIDIYVCSLKLVNRTTTLINIEGNYTKPMKTVLINSQLFKKSEIKYRPFLVNVTDDLCQFFSKNKGSPYLRIIWPIVEQYTNMNHECPYFGYHYIKNLPVDPEKLPAVWPSGRFLLEVSQIEAYNKRVLTAQLYFEFSQRQL